jgi:hypothetical protein
VHGFVHNRAGNYVVSAVADDTATKKLQLFQPRGNIGFGRGI